MSEKIIVEMQKLQDLNCGLGQFCLHLGKGLAKLPQVPVTFYVPEKRLGLFPNTRKISVKSIHKSLSWTRPRAKLWHLIHQDSVYTPPCRGKYVLTIHDLNFLWEEHDLEKVSKRVESLQKLVSRASAITFISEFTKKIATENLSLPDVPLPVIYNGLALNDAADERKPEGLSFTRPFLFTISAITPKKNTHLLMEMMKFLPEFNLVIAGSTFHPYAKKIIESVNKENLASRVIILGEVTENEKKWLYSHCHGFVFPSQLEGFGLPPAESMFYKKPLFVSNLTSLPEICGKGAIYFENLTPESMAATVQTGLTKFKENEKSFALAQSSQLEQFSWDMAAKKYSELYLSLL